MRCIRHLQEMLYLTFSILDYESHRIEFIFSQQGKPRHGKRNNYFWSFQLHLLSYLHRSKQMFSLHCLLIRNIRDNKRTSNQHKGWLPTPYQIPGYWFIRPSIQINEKRLPPLRRNKHLPMCVQYRQHLFLQNISHIHCKLRDWFLITALVIHLNVLVGEDFIFVWMCH